MKRFIRAFNPLSIFLLFSFFAWSSLANCKETLGNLESLVKNTDLIISGKIIEIKGPFILDLGTESYHVTIDVDKVIKQNYFIQNPKIQITWVVSNLRCID